MRSEVACFAVTLYREGRKLTVQLDSATTIKRGVVAGEWDGVGGGTAWLRRLGAVGSRFHPAEAKRVERVAHAFARLLGNLDVDLGECSCAPGDPCPAHALVKALGGTK